MTGCHWLEIKIKIKKQILRGLVQFSSTHSRKPESKEATVLVLDFRDWRGLFPIFLLLCGRRRGLYSACAYRGREGGGGEGKKGAWITYGILDIGYWILDIGYTYASVQD